MADRTLYFAAQLRRHRARTGLTQEALAERAGLSARGISDLERGAKTRPHRRTVDQLCIAFALSGAERDAFIAESRFVTSNGLQSARIPEAFRTNLPIPPNPLLGRGAELETLAALIRKREVRLLTLTGTGGTGKTRLALEVARELGGDFPDGVFMVPLAPLDDARLVSSTIALILGVRETNEQGLVKSVADQRLLLVLDNFEHVLAAASLVSDLISMAPDVVVLATSRAPLGLAAERIFPVSPLAVPSGMGDANASTPTAAEDLFVQRAVAARLDLNLTANDTVAIAAICRHLDGLPLAIELAAARCRLLSPQAIASRLERRLPLLTGGFRDAPERHQTLRAALTWSYELLSSDVQSLFRRMSIFSGGFTLEAATALEDDGSQATSEELLDRLGLLANQNLLERGDGADGEPRFTMLETVREYGIDLLESVGEVNGVTSRHADFYLGLAIEAESELVGARQLVWFNQLEAEHGNLRSALGWALSHDAGRAVAMIGSLIRFWDHHGHVAEGMRWIATALDTDEGRISPLRGKLLWGGGTLALILGEYEQAVTWLTEAIPAALGAGDRYHAGFALNTLGTVTSDLGNLQLARRYHEQGLGLMRDIGNKDGIAALLGNLGHDAMLMGNYPQAIESCASSLAIYRELGSAHGIASMLSELGQATLMDGQLARSSRLLREGIVHADELGNNIYRIYFLLSLAVLATREGTWRRAAYLFGALDSLTSQLSYSFPPFHRTLGEEARSIAAGQMGQAQFGEAQAKGGRMAISDVTALALAVDES